MARRTPATHRTGLLPTLLALAALAVPVALLPTSAGPAAAAPTFVDPLPGTVTAPTLLTVDPTGAATSVLTVTNPSAVNGAGIELSGLTAFEWSSTSGGCASVAPLPTSDPVSIAIDPGAVCTISARVTAPAAPGAAVEDLVYALAYEVDFGNLDGHYTLRATTPVPPAPTNDEVAGATDISSIAIPPFAGGAAGPTTVSAVDGTTVGATFDADELAAGSDIDFSGSVWFRYTATAAFEGRIGYRSATTGVFVSALIADAGVTSPATRGDLREPSGNVTTPWSHQFVRVEAGQTVWFQVAQSSTGTPGPFTIELYQAPDPTEDIALAFDAWPGTDASVPSDGSEIGWFGDGDTFHTAGDDTGDGSAVVWSTLRFTQSVTFRAQVSSIDATRRGSLRPLRLRVYRAPSTAYVANPAVLGAPIATVDSVAGPGVAFVVGTASTAVLPPIDLAPGRYYFAVSTAPSQPTIFFNSYRWSAAGPGDTTPPSVSIVTPVDGATVEVADVPAAVSFDATDDSGAAPSCTVTPPTPPTAPGTHTITVECSDAAGNVGSDSATYTVLAPRADLVMTGRVSLSTSAVPLVVGGDVTGAIGVGNLGPQATVAQVRITLDGLALRAGAPLPAGFSAATGVWTVPVAAGADQLLSLPLVATRSGTLALTGEVIASTVADPDSTPGNGTTGAASAEDDHAGGTIAAVAPVSRFALQYSTSAQRTAPLPLDGATVGGGIAVFVPAAADVARVEFFLNDPTASGAPRQVERFAPYDFAGTSGGNAAALFSTRTLADGPHSITARVVLRNGSSQLVTSTFTVSNPRPATRRLLVSTQSTRTGAQPLDGGTVSGPVAVFVPDEAGIARVEFRVDGRLVQTERVRPYDLGGTLSNGRASLVRFTPGARTVTARIVFTDGTSDTIQAAFTAS